MIVYNAETNDLFEVNSISNINNINRRGAP